MRIKLYIGCLFLSILLFCGCGFSASSGSDYADSAIMPASPSSFTLGHTQTHDLSCNFTVPNMDSVLQQAKPYPFPENVKAVTMPHHLVAASMIASAVKGAAAVRDKTDTVVIIAPNHAGLGGDLITTQKGFITVKGAIENDNALTQKFLTGKVGAVINDSVCEGDHSASAIVPFVKAVFPNAKISVLLFARVTPESEVETAMQTIADYAKTHNVLLIGSVDFSHGLTAKKAYPNDMMTQRIVTSGQPADVYPLTNEWMDSPQTVSGVMLYVNDLKPGASLSMYDHANAAFFLQNNKDWNNDKMVITTYMIYAG